MPRVSRISEAPPEAVEQALCQLGRSIQTARQAHGLTLDALAERVGTSRFVMADIEAGKPTTAVAAYLGALWALDRLPDFSALPTPAAEDIHTRVDAATGTSTPGNDPGTAEDWLALLEAIPGEPWNRARVGRGLFSLARACGLRVADSRLARVDDADVLLVRTAARAPIRDSDTADAPKLGAFLTVADQLRRQSAAPRAELRELFARLCFRTVVRQRVEDAAYLRLDPDGQCRLAPLIVTGVESPAIETSQPGALGSAGSPLTRTMLPASCGRFLLGAAQAQAIIDATLATVDAQWRLAMRRAGVGDAECERIAPAFGGL